jgi:radical SAM PhpK family P-methyltransferase
MNATQPIDCIVIGYNEVDFEKVKGELERTKEYSGAYSRKFKAGSVYLQGRRVNYMKLLNEVLKETTGVDHGLHVLELPNLGVTYLTSFLRERGLRVEFINFFNKGKERLGELLEGGARSVAVTTTFYGDMTPINEIVQFVRAHSKDAKIVVGGAHIFNVCHQNDSLTQDFVFRATGADVYVNDSQGEAALAALVSELRGGGRDFSHIPNLVYRAEGEKRFRRTPRAVEDNSLNENFVRWKHFDREFYVPTAVMRTARSCAYKCSFCNYPFFAGDLSLTDISVVEREMHELKEAGVKYLQVTDDTFNVPLPRFKNLLRMMIRNRFDFRWFSYLRCGNADVETFDLLVESGCAGVFLGIESADDQILLNMNKKVSARRYAEAMVELHARGIVTFVSLICGFPGETEASVRHTIDFMNETKPTYYDLELYYHSITAPIHKESAKYNIKGSGYGWSHATMDWRRANGLLHEMYKEIKGSVVMPEQSFSMYAIPYLLGKGLTMKQIHGFCSIAHEMLIKSLSDEVVDTSAEERRLLDFFRHAQAEPGPDVVEHFVLKRLDAQLQEAS